MSNLAGKGVEVRAMIHITRAATGLVETFDIVGHSDPEKLADLATRTRTARAHGSVGGLVGQGAGLSNQQKE